MGRRSNRLSIHQWICSAIHASQQPTSPIGFLSLKLPPPPCAVLLVLEYCGHFPHVVYLSCLMFFLSNMLPLSTVYRRIQDPGLWVFPGLRQGSDAEWRDHLPGWQPGGLGGSVRQMGLGQVALAGARFVFDPLLFWGFPEIRLFNSSRSFLEACWFGTFFSV